MSKTTAREVIADWLHDAAIQNGFENSRGKSINDHADAILSALRSAGLVVVPVETEAEAARLHAALQTVRHYTKGGPDHVSDEDITNIFRVADAALRGEEV